MRWLLLFLVVTSAFGLDTNQHGINFDWSPANWTRTMDVPPEIKPFSWALTNSHWRYSTNSGKTWDYGSGAEPYHHYVDGVNGTNYGPYTYFVDREHGSAIDSGNTYGSPSTPRLTWPYPLAAGAVVMVRGDGYTFANASSLWQNGGTGTEDNPIFIVGVPDEGTDFDEVGDDGEPTNWPSITRGTGSLQTAQGNWLFMENLRLLNHTSIGTRPNLKNAPCTNIVFRNIYSRGNAPNDTGPNAAFDCATADGVDDWTENFVMLHCDVADFGDKDSLVQNDLVGFIAAEFTTNFWCGYSRIGRMGGDSGRIGADQGASPSGRYYFVFENSFFENGENGFDVKQARHAVVTRNAMYRTIAALSSSSGTAIAVHYAPQDLWIMNNYVFEIGVENDDANGIETSDNNSDTTCYIIGNVMRDIPNYGINPDRASGNFLVYNNTVVHAGAYGIATRGTITSQTNRNNIIVNAGSIHATEKDYFRVTDSAVRAATTVSHMLLYRPPSNGNSPIYWGTTYNTAVDWIAGTTQGDFSFNANPLFVNINSDYNLTADSPAINAGYDWSDLDTHFKESFGNDVSCLYDMNGTLRGTGGGFDIGALEFDFGSVSSSGRVSRGRLTGGARLR